MTDEAPGGAIVVDVAGLTDVGRQRAENEDTFHVGDLGGGLSRGPEVMHERRALAGGFVLGVYDGMGGASTGRWASDEAARAVHASLSAAPAPQTEDALRERLAQAVMEANRAILAIAERNRNRNGAGSTATVAALVDACLILAQVGDSRGYLLRGRRLVQLTRDDRLDAEMARQANPALTAEELAAIPPNIITKALGMGPGLEPGVSRLVLRRGDVIVLCTDGLWGELKDDVIRGTLLRQRDPGVAARVLREQVLAAGAHDNVTVIVARFEGDGLRPPIRAEVVD